MARVRIGDMARVLRAVNNHLAEAGAPTLDLEGHYGKWSLTTNSGGRTISPLMTKPEMLGTLKTVEEVLWTLRGER